MDERAVRAMLGVMNLTAPFESQWCAEIVKVGPVAQEQGCEENIRFWLVREGSLMWENEELLWA